MALSAADEHLMRAEQALRIHVVEWRWYPVVQALMTMRGIDFVAATTLTAELGDFRRFPSAPSLMSFVGLVPSEHSSGARQRRGNAPDDGMCCAGFNGTVGPPVVFSATHFSALRRLDHREGAKHMLQDPTNHVVVHPMKSAAWDIDTTQDLERLLDVSSYIFAN